MLHHDGRLLPTVLDKPGPGPAGPSDELCLHTSDLSTPLEEWRGHGSELLQVPFRKKEEENLLLGSLDDLRHDP